jgi:hypothetical protein
MEKRTRYYANFLAPGSFVAENWTVEVASADPRAVHWPDSAYAFTLHSQDEIVYEGVTYRADRKQIGKTFYHPASKVESLSEARNNPNATRTLISNMEGNRWAHIVWTRWGNWPQPFDTATAEVL